jgi:SAM-dependent methyltransferase
LPPDGLPERPLSGLTNVARRLPTPLKSSLKTLARPVDPLYVRWYRGRSGDRTPIPPLRLRARVGSGYDIRAFVADGRRVADVLDFALERHERPLSGAESVLDFGCGCGRVTRHLYADVSDPAVLHGCDVDAEAVAWSARNLSGATFAVNGFEPPLPFPDSNFDVLYSISIFTHLDEAAQMRWLEDVRRVLRPGGLALLTTNGPTALEMFRTIASNSPDFTARIRAAEIPETGFLFEPYERSRWNEADFSGIEGAYGLSIQTEEQIRTRWSPMLEVVDFGSGVVNNGQDLVVLAR